MDLGFLLCKGLLVCLLAQCGLYATTQHRAGSLYINMKNVLHALSVFLEVHEYELSFIPPLTVQGILAGLFLASGGTAHSLVVGMAFFALISVMNSTSYMLARLTVGHLSSLFFCYITKLLLS